MKKTFALFGAMLAAMAAAAALPQPDLLARIHFAGASKIAATPNAGFFAPEFTSPDALALRKQTADKLAPWLAAWLQTNAGAAQGGAAGLRPLLDDFQSSEWRLEARIGKDGKPVVALAIRLDSGRASVWEKNLKAVLPSAIFKNSNGWSLVGRGLGAETLAQSLVQQSAGGEWLALDINWPGLGRWYPGLKQLGLPQTQLVVTAQDEFLINGTFFFPDDLVGNLEAWRMPTNTVRQPLVSFTAVRGFATWLKTQPWPLTSKFTPSPNQYFVWALARIPYQTFAALPVPDAAGALDQAYAALVPLVAARQQAGGFATPVRLERTNNEVRLAGVPYAAPYLQAVKEPSGQFLVAGGFLNTPSREPLPQELFTRLAQKELVLYHWEITAERMPQVLQAGQLGLLMTQRRQLAGNSLSMRLIQLITPKFGNTVTQIKKTGPAEMSFTRKAPGGLTAMEFYMLACWLESPGFPSMNLDLPPRYPKPPRSQQPKGALPNQAPSK